MQHNEISILDRFIAASSYMTMGTVGMLWFLINYFVFKKPSGKFLMYNLFQSFIIAILFAIISLACNIFCEFFSHIPIIKELILTIYLHLFVMPKIFHLSYIHFIVLFFLSYLSIFALFGKLPLVPYVTDIAKRIYR